MILGAVLAGGLSSRFGSDKALAEYVAAQTYNADRPEAHINLGNLYQERNQADGAIAEYRRALALDPTATPRAGAFPPRLTSRCPTTASSPSAVPCPTTSPR